MRLMTSHRVRHMPVLRNGKLAGLISIGDVVKHRLDDLNLKRASSAMSTVLATDGSCAVLAGWARPQAP